MLSKKAFIAVLAATTFLTAGVAYAADQQPGTPPMSAQQKTADKDAGKLSADGSRAYMEINSARVAIFDGRTDDAKKLISQADSDMGTAKSDVAVFTKAESDLKGPQQATSGGKGNSNSTDTTTPKEWLPVAGGVSVNEDLTGSPAKKAAVADANKSLASGDKKGAMEKLRVAAVDVDYAMAVIPLKQSVSDVHQAATLINDGKFYEASQMLRTVQDSTRFDALDIVGVPKSGSAPDSSGMKASKTSLH